MVKKTHEKINDIYLACCRETGAADLKAIFKYFWSSLDNGLSAVDLTGKSAHAIMYIAYETYVT